MENTENKDTNINDEIKTEEVNVKTEETIDKNIESNTVNLNKEATNDSTQQNNNVNYQNNNMNQQANINNDMQKLMQEIEEKKAGNKLAWISLGLAFIPGIVSALISLIMSGIYGISEELFSSDISSLIMAGWALPNIILGLLIWAGRIAALITIIYAVVQYPKNIFAKVVMWFYVVSVLLAIIAFILIFATCYSCIQSCPA